MRDLSNAIWTAVLPRISVKLASAPCRINTCNISESSFTIAIWILVCDRNGCLKQTKQTSNHPIPSPSHPPINSPTFTYAARRCGLKAFSMEDGILLLVRGSEDWETAEDNAGVDADAADADDWDVNISITMEVSPLRTAEWNWKQQYLCHTRWDGLDWVGMEWNGKWSDEWRVSVCSQMWATRRSSNHTTRSRLVNWMCASSCWKLSGLLAPKNNITLQTW